jgi:alcohol dehydrogenase class IV
VSVFRASGYDWRLTCGAGAIERGVPEAAARAGAGRVFVVCSPSIARRTDLVGRIEACLGGRFAGVFDGIAKDSSYGSVVAATAAARAAGADMLVAVGGGSVIVAVRAVAIFLGEAGDPFALMTQYPEGKPAFSPRLEAAKLPIVNVPTTPTSAANRAGTGLLNPELDHRMEYFDPKTRPRAVVLDEAALGATPFEVLRSAATTVFAGTLASMAQLGLNPLAEGDRDQAFRLARRAYLRLADGRDDAGGRVELALAAFLQNRGEDDGAPRFRGGAFAGNYAVSTALHLLYPHVGQGEATSVVHAAGMRIAAALDGAVDLAEARQVAEAMGVWRAGMDGRAAALAVADAVEAVYARVGVPTRLRDLDVPREGLASVAGATVKNFNANAGVRSAEAQVAEALRLLEAAW